MRSGTFVNRDYVEQSLDCPLRKIQLLVQMIQHYLVECLLLGALVERINFFQKLPS